MRVTAHAVAFHLPIHKNASFHGWERKNDPAVHENGGFRGRERKNDPAVHENGDLCGRGPRYLLYLHDLGVILSMTLSS